MRFIKKLIFLLDETNMTEIDRFDLILFRNKEFLIDISNRKILKITINEISIILYYFDKVIKNFLFFILIFPFS